MPTTLAPSPQEAPTSQIHSYRRPLREPHRKPQPKSSEAFGPLKKQHPWYDFNPVLSHNGAWNFIPGARGIGKTFGAKKLALNAFIKRGDQFIYLRRYKEELIARDTFFADIQHLYPDWMFRANGNTFEAARKPAGDGKPKWETMGYARALSTSQRDKSQAFPRVKLIIFDEFIVEKSVMHYLPAEATLMLNFFSTVDRGQDKTRVLFLANAVSILNPYFIEYKINPNDADEDGIIKLADGFIVCHFPNSSDFEESMLQTRFGRFIRGTDYAKYAIANKFSDNNGQLVKPKNPRARYKFTLQLRDADVSVWEDRMGGEFYVTNSIPKNPVMFTYVREKMGEGKVLLLSSDLVIGRLRNAFRTGKTYFDHDATRLVYQDIFRQNSG
jgi:Podovirus DNA encapsidation protein (Gp16)